MAAVLPNKINEQSCFIKYNFSALPWGKINDIFGGSSRFTFVAT